LAILILSSFSRLAPPCTQASANRCSWFLTGRSSKHWSYLSAAMSCLR
jgi:hypothetical protein